MEIIVFVFDVGHKQGLDLVCSHSYNIIMVDIQGLLDVFISNFVIVQATKVDLLHFITFSEFYVFSKMWKKFDLSVAALYY